MKILVTGSSGLIGSEVVRFFDWCDVHGIDNNSREIIFGPDGSTLANRDQLVKLKHFTHHEIDIRDFNSVKKLIDDVRFDAVVHCAAQPSHDRAASIPFTDFEINAIGTLSLLEAIRPYATPFVYMSTNKVYGDGPNELQLIETEKRYDLAPPYQDGIGEGFNIDQCKHSLFGASKLSADIYVQEYGRYFGIPTAVLRGGCLTGANHAGVEMHGFLNYLIKAHVKRIPYTVYGYKGKQVRDNIHAYDVASFIHAFLQAPREAEVYNIGGGKGNSCSILEAFDMIGEISWMEPSYTISETNRIGDHICYYSDLSKCKAHYPQWGITRSLYDIFTEIYESYA